MGEMIKFDYYYGIEAEQFSFYRVPKILIKDKRFSNLSSDAKLLYGLMLDRMSLSVKNGWLDDKNRAYIIYTIDSIMEDLGCAKATCVKIIKELDSEKGIGLIEKKRRGLGKPDIIYVKNFSSTLSEQQETDPNINEPQEVQKIDFKKSRNYTYRSSNFELPEVQNLNFQKSTNASTKGSIFKPAKVQNIDPNNTNINYTDFSDIQSIDHAVTREISEENGKMDRINTYIAIIKNNIEYDYFMQYGQWKDRELYKELFEIICEIVCVECDTVKIDGKKFPYEVVKSRFLELNSEHLKYVIECMYKITTKINNIKAYMITALYNAPTTINHYYQNAVSHDMYGQEDNVN